MWVRVSDFDGGIVMLYTRRDMGRLTLGAAPVVAGFGATAPNSVFGGVQIGVITYSYRGINKIDDIIDALIRSGVNEVELMSASAEAEAGAPSGRGGGGAAGQGRGQGRGAGAVGGAAEGGAAQAPAAGRAQGSGTGSLANAGIRPPMTEEQLAAARNQPRALELKQWRLSVPMSAYQAIGKRFSDSGIDLRLLCFNMNEAITDEELDYAFRMAKALGARAITTSTQITVAKRVAPIAEAHKMPIGFHGHDNIQDPNETGSLESYQKALSFGKYNFVNADIGYFTAAGYDAIAFIKSHKDRITNLHLKDRTRTRGSDLSRNLPWGQGETPVREILQLMKQEKYPFPANIEMSYTPPEGSDSVTEVAKCVKLCKEYLG
jgi:sugar phosphate isomerase/epimerase